MSEYDGSADPKAGAAGKRPRRDTEPAEDAQGPQDVQAGQEADRAAAAIDNQREGFGGPSGSRQGRSTPASESAREIARKQGEQDA